MNCNNVAVILEDIRSAFNVGSIFRTADAAKIEKLYLTGITPYPPHNRIPKTALGAVETVPWEFSKHIDSVIENFSGKRELIAIENSPEAVSLWDYNFKAPCAIILGNEISGITASTLQKVDSIVKIPMYGSKESLNVANAFAITIYEILRQWLHHE